MEKQFAEVKKGYDPDEVNMFLDEIIEELKRREMDRRELQAKVEEAEKSIAYYSEMEQALKDALLRAQKSSEELMASTQKRADDILRRAELEGQRAIEEYRQSAKDQMAQLEELKKSSAVLRENYRNMLIEELRKVENGQLAFDVEDREPVYEQQAEQEEYIPGEDSFEDPQAY